MTENISTYRDPSFNINQAYYHTLLIQIDGGTFAYAIIHKSKLVAWSTDHPLSELSDTQNQPEELAATYKRVIIGLPANSFTLVPQAIYSADQVANYARLLDVKPNEKVFAQSLTEQDHIIYTVDQKIVSAVQNFGLENTVFAHKGWITAAAKTDPAYHDLYLHTGNGKAEYLYFKNDKINLYNSFEYRTADDLGYYTTLITDELGLSPSVVQLKLSGSVKTGDKFASRLSGFFPNVRAFEAQLLELPPHIDPQQILTLAALSLCALSEVH